jgi:hypothetical protein
MGELDADRMVAASWRRFTPPLCQPPVRQIRLLNH